ncbi:MAG: LysR family transcriptional regulator [Sedimentibacter saalensis]|uniref:LysR family transcriptional regulator n=1 Tax=Sedimentibacter saalensis TaxID=130788 RepID=UPI002B1F2195|nr:LysR family transcriptional regulator [Sedimentibacter saalensis]MEA5093848.1 LysR family transcriptional regulator [Sedimentibacter saalensis]
MTIRHLKIFIAVCDYKKMSLAAEKLFMAQPSVSQVIAEIEQHYGVRVFERLSKKLYLTEAGENLLKYARHIVSSFEEMEDSLLKSSSNTSLKIGATITVGTCVLNDILNDFKLKKPNISTKVYVENTNVIEEMILKSKLDLGIVEGIIKSRDIITVPIVSDELTLVCPLSHEFSSLEEITADKLNNQDFILREEGSGTRELFEKKIENLDITINKKWICNNSEAIKNAVISGQGLTVISQMLVRKEIEEKKLHAIKINDLKLTRNFYLAYHKSKYLSDNLKSFISTCMDCSIKLS